VVTGSSKPSSVRGYQEIRWVEAPKLATLAMSSAMAKILIAPRSQSLTTREPLVRPSG